MTTTPERAGTRMAVSGMAGVDGEVGAADVVRAARRAFLAGERLDIRALANRLGIARATIYRWYGGRERILGRVLARGSHPVHVGRPRLARRLDLVGDAHAAVGP